VVSIPALDLPVVPIISTFATLLKALAKAPFTTA
jgi:hypothetical protein